MRMFDSAGADAYFMLGNTLSLISNRVSHAFDLRGPSLTIDTACSSSLVALHHAVEALNAGQMEVAIVLGVNMLLSPFPFIGFAQASMLSPEGLCRPFDANAQGYVRGEGGVALVLRRADATLVDAPRCYGRIVATGINADGRTVGVSLPSAESQRALIERIYAQAGVKPDDLAFVEAHGTGTRVGDPAEARALGEGLGRHRRRPLPIGSVKSNIGHLEPASGVAGMLKAMLALEHDLLPPTLHVSEPNPDIPFGNLNLAIARQAVALPRELNPRAAGISSFGFGGTNAHVIIADAAPEQGARSLARPRPAARQPRGMHEPGIIVLSATSESALRALAGRHLEHQATTRLDPGLVASAVGHFRELLPERAAVLATTRADLETALSAAKDGQPSPLLVRGRTLAKDLKTAFVFSGNGSQWVGMGRVAFTTNADFRRTFEHIDELFRPLAAWSLLEALSAADLAQRLASTRVAQPLLFAVQVATTTAVREMGLAPDMVLGHSVGEVAAAHVAGALSLETAVRVIAARSTHQEPLKGAGAMAAVRLGAQAAQSSVVESRLQGLEIAAVNSPRSVTLAGTRKAIEAYAGFAATQNIGCKVLELDYPFHSRLLAPAEAPLLADLRGLEAQTCPTPFISTVTGDAIDGRKLDAAYWWRNVRDPVQFAAAVAAARHAEARLFVEIGPRPILQGYLGECFAEAGAGVAAIPGLHPDDAEGRDPIRRIVATAITRGASVDHDLAFGPRPSRAVGPPTYPWQYAQFRPQDTPEALGGLGTSSPHHPLLGGQALAHDHSWRAHLDTANLPWLADHRVDGQAVFPGSGFAEIALAAARRWLGEDGVEIRDMDILAPLILRDGETSETRVQLFADTGTLEIASRPRLSDQAFQVHAVCRLAKLPAASAPRKRRAAQRTSRADVTADSVYRAARRFGLDYGPAFRRIQRLRRVGEAAVELVFADPAPSDAGGDDFALHPCDLDAAFHGLFVLADISGAGNREPVPLVPIRFGELRLLRPGCRVARARLAIRRSSARSVQADIQLYDDTDALVATLHDARFAAMRLRPKPSLGDAAYRDSWQLAYPRREMQAHRNRNWEALRAHASEMAGTFASPAAEPRLLLEAAARRIAYDAVAAAADGEARVAPFANDAPGLPTRANLLMLLQDCGLAQEDGDGWRLGPSTDLPPAADLVNAVLAEHPDWSADAVLLNRAARLLQAHLAATGTQPEEERHSRDTLEHFFSASPRHASATRRLLAIVQEAVARHPQAHPLRVCLLGARGTFAAQLAELLGGEGNRLVIVDDDKRLLERARLRTAKRCACETVDLGSAARGLAEHGPYDLAVSAFGLSRLHRADDCLAEVAVALAPGGLLLAVETAPDAYHDVVFGLEPSWFARSLDAQFPIGALRTAQEWLGDLRRARFPKVDAIALDDATTSMVLMAQSATTADVAVDRTKPAQQPDAKAPAARAPVDILTASRRDLDFAQALTKELDAVGRPAVALISSKGNGKDVAHRSAANGRHAPEHPLNGARSHGSAASAPDAAGRELVWIGQATDDASIDPCKLLQDRVGTLASLLAQEHEHIARLWIVAPGAVRAVAAMGSTLPTQAGMWAFARTAANEYSSVDVRLVDVDQDLSIDEAARRLAAVIAHPGPEREIILTRRGVAALRVRRGASTARAAGRGRRTKPRRSRQRAVLAQLQTGRLESLAWQHQSLPRPRRGEVLIDVAATGLNFRDVMWALGLLPEEALEAGFAGPTLGFECSGTIAAVGPDVEHLKIGDRVVALAPQAFASQVAVSTTAVARLPDRVELAAAASIPVAFLTAYYALHHLAHLSEGEWVLIHGGAGGVGLAAIQIAHWRGARVIATAGTQEKRDLLALLGAEHVLSSRSLAFVDEVRTITRGGTRGGTGGGSTGGGVDVVLNSLFGEAMERSLELLKPFGRFLELGKRDFYANTKIGLRPLRHNVSYFAVDADQLLSQQGRLASGLMDDLMRHFEVGSFTPLPHRAFASGDVVDAFRLMQQSGHIGKIIVTAPAPDRPTAAPAADFAASDSGTHVIVGGLGGFGLATATWLADRGAKSIVLVGRSGRAAEGSQHLLDDLRQRDVALRICQCDAADAEALQQVLDSIRRETPIKGVVHAAMVLQDALIRNLDAVAIRRVLEPKVAAAANLDRLTRDDRLDYFWLYSSITTLIGNPGQAAYVAANGYLEGLARARRAADLPALAVRWGAIEDVGTLARDRKTAADLNRRAGASGLRARDALDMLAMAMRHDDGSQASAVLTLAVMDWAEARAQLPVLRSPAFEDLSDGPEAAASATSVDLADAIQNLDDAAAHDVLARHLASELAAILRMAADDINWQRPLPELGLDSLMVVELRTAANRRFGLELPLASLADGASISSIATKLVRRLRTGQPAQSAALTADLDLAAKHVGDALDESEVQRLKHAIERQADKNARVTQ